MWKAGAALLGVAGASYVGWDFYQANLLAFPRLPAPERRPKHPYLLYVHSFDHESKHLAAVKDLEGIEKFAVRADQLPQDIAHQVGKQAGVYLCRTVDNALGLNSFDSSNTAKLQKWLALHLEAHTLLESVETLQSELLQRNKSHFLDSIVVAYAPDDSDRLQQYDEIIEKVKYNDFGTLILMGQASTHVKFFRIKDPQVATALNIDTEGPLKLYKYKDSRGLYDLRLPKSAYVNPERLKAYLATHLATNYKINGNLMQLDLGIYRDEFAYVPETSPSVEGKLHSYPTLEGLAAGLSRIDPLICPLWSVKDLQIMVMKVAGFLRKHSKVMVVSVNKDRDERDLSDLGILMRQLKIDQIAKENPDLLIVTGEPMFISHLPIQDLAYFHNEQVEIRLLDVREGRVVSTANYNGEGSLNDWVKQAEPSLQTAPEHPPENATHIDAEGLQRVLTDDQCYFVMFCSSTCPACTYTAPFFQASAALPSPCKHLKYNISNECPTSKPPGATPTFLLYRPGSKDAPVKYDVRKHGLGAEKFQAFIKEQTSSNAE